MRIREESTMRADAGRAWALVCDPRRHGEWNPRIVATEVYGDGVPGRGMRYRITYEMSGRQSEFDAEVVEFTPAVRWAARLVERDQGDGGHMGRFMLESYVLEPRGGGTHVVHDVDIH